MSVLIKGITAEQLLDVFEWARTGANNCMIGHGVIVTELPDHGDLIEKKPIVDALAVAEKNVSAVQRVAETEKDIRYCQGVMVGYANTILAIDNAPVVIPAERSEEECEDENWYTELDDPKIAERSEE